MNNGVYLHICITAKIGVEVETIEKQMNLAVDWYRYTFNNYVVYTTSDIEKWMRRLKPLVKDGGNLLIFEIKANKRNGWMPKEFWLWLKENRD